MPIHRRLPKRGFTISSARNTSRLISAACRHHRRRKLDTSKPVDIAALLAGVISKPRDGVRILAKGELKAKVEIHAAGA